MHLSPLSPPPKWSQTCCTRGEPSSGLAAWLSSLWSTSWERQRPSFSLSCPMTTTWPSASLCTTRPSCDRGSASSWWWWLGLGGSYMPWSRFSLQSAWPSVVPMSLTASCVISSHCWNLPAATPTGLELWWPLTQGACACSFFFFHALHLLHSHPELPEIPWLWSMAQGPLHMWLPLYSSGVLFCPLYIHLHASCVHLSRGQVGGCILCNPHSHAKSYHLHSEKHRGENCHEKFAEEERNLDCLWSQESNNLYT